MPAFNICIIIMIAEIILRKTERHNGTMWVTEVSAAGGRYSEPEEGKTTSGQGTAPRCRSTRRLFFRARMCRPLHKPALSKGGWLAKQDGWDCHHTYPLSFCRQKQLPLLRGAFVHSHYSNRTERFFTGTACSE